MFSTQFFKRFIPFFAALIFGLFVASFFVNIIPSIKFNKNRHHRRHEVRQLKMENQRLRIENDRLRMEKFGTWEKRVLLEDAVPAPPPMTVPAR